jgi:hypothetical protein
MRGGVQKTHRSMAIIKRTQHRNNNFQSANTPNHTRMSMPYPQRSNPINTNGAKTRAPPVIKVGRKAFSMTAGRKIDIINTTGKAIKDTTPEIVQQTMMITLSLLPIFLRMAASRAIPREQSRQKLTLVGREGIKVLMIK